MDTDKKKKRTTFLSSLVKSGAELFEKQNQILELDIQCVMSPWPGLSIISNEKGKLNLNLKQALS